MKHMNFAVMAFALVVSTTSLYAHHEQGTKTGEELFDRVLDLTTAVTYSNLAFPIKSTVYNFSDVAFRFANCVTEAAVEAANNPIPAGTVLPISRHHEQAACASLSLRTRASLAPVDQFLSGTKITEPRVYEAYLATQAAFAEID